MRWIKVLNTLEPRADPSRTPLQTYWLSGSCLKLDFDTCQPIFYLMCAVFTLYHPGSSIKISAAFQKSVPWPLLSLLTTSVVSKIEGCLTDTVFYKTLLIAVTYFLSFLIMSCLRYSIILLGSMTGWQDYNYLGFPHLSFLNMLFWNVLIVPHFFLKINVQQVQKAFSLKHFQPSVWICWLEKWEARDLRPF